MQTTLTARTKARSSLANGDYYALIVEASVMDGVVARAVDETAAAKVDLIMNLHTR